MIARLNLGANTNPLEIAAAPLFVLLEEPVFPSVDQTVQRFSLNVKQEAAVRAVLEHYHMTKQGLEPPQLKMAILGEPGVGKSVVASAISWHFSRHNDAECIVVTAFTGVHCLLFLAPVSLFASMLTLFFSLRQSCCSCERTNTALCT